MTVLWRGRSQPRPLCVSQGIYPQQGSSALFLLTHFTSWPRPSPFPHAHRNFCSFILASSQNISEHAGGGALLPDSITTKSDNFFLTFASSLLCDVCLREKLPLCPFNLWVLRASLKGGKCLSLIPFKYVDQISPPQWDLWGIASICKSCLLLSLCHSGFLQNIFLIQSIVVLYIYICVCVYNWPDRCSFLISPLGYNCRFLKDVF